MEPIQFFTEIFGASALSIKGGESRAELTADGIKKIADVSLLRELSLERVVVRDDCLQGCRRLTHLTLCSVKGVRLEALAEMKELKFLEHRDALCFDITQYIHVKRLETLIGDFPSLEPLRVVRVLRDLPNLRRVKELPVHDPKEPNGLIAFFEGLQHVPKYVRRVIFSLKDEFNHDFLFYCKQLLDSEGVEDAQKEKIRGELCRLLEPGLLTAAACSNHLFSFMASQELTLVEKMLSLGPNLNRPDSEGNLPLIEALKARSTSYLWKDIVEKMVTGGAQADHPDKSGTFALQLAV